MLMLLMWKAVKRLKEEQLVNPQLSCRILDSWLDEIGLQLWLQAPTHAIINQSDVLDDDDDETFKENDDDDDLNDVDRGAELNSHRLALAQFDKQSPSRWLNQRPTLDVHVAYVGSRQEIERLKEEQPVNPQLMSMQ